jgi:hypothetical protein
MTDDPLKQFVERGRAAQSAADEIINRHRGIVPGEYYVVWSIEHDAWWPASCCGYVRTLAEAGHFTRDEARAILKRANYPPGTFHECMIPLDAFGLHPHVPTVAIRMGTDDEQRRALMLGVAVREVERGAAHECDEWRDFYDDRRCAVCGRTAD